MKLKSIFLLITCIIVINCGLMKPSVPPAEKVNAALDKAIKKENPNAAYSVTEQTYGATGKQFTVKFNFTNFDFTDASDQKKSLPNGRGEANFDYSENGKWTLTRINVFAPNMIPGKALGIPVE